jgi:cold shock CspA family protein
MRSIQLAQLQEQLDSSVGEMNSQSFVDFLNCNYRSIGVVKWYDRKKKYGFIRSMLSHEDLFVHCHDLASQGGLVERYLVTGEYVEYEKASVGDRTGHSFKAIHVKGVCGGPLMFESLSGTPPSMVAKFTPLGRIAPAGVTPSSPSAFPPPRPPLA